MQSEHYFAHESAIIDNGAQIGKDTKIWHFTHIMPTAIIGSDCNLGQNVFVGNDVILGNQVKVQNNVSIYSGVVCEDNVFLGPSAVFTNVINPRSEVVRQGEYQRTYLRKGVTIGANATIVCGVELEPYVFVGAGAVVTKSFPSFALVVGNPAKQMGWMSTAGFRLQFDANGQAKCPHTQQTYLLKDGQVSILP